jgi:CHAT domain-containing protein
MLQAGIPSIIAPNWAVDGASTAMMMARFYDAWQTGGTSIAEALRRSQCWLRDSTNEEKARWFSMQVDECDFDDAEILVALRRLWQASVRKPPMERTYAHPLHWAAFAHVGAS